MPDCNDPDRRALILRLAHDAALEASQSLLEHAIHTQDSKTIEVCQRLLENALTVKDAWNTNLTWNGSGYIKTVENVLAKGMPLPVKSGACKIEECPTCFYENICAREADQKLMDRSREAIDKLQAGMKELDEIKARKASMDREKQAIRDADTAWVNSKIRQTQAYIG